jgi:hypothetical protein
MKIKSISFLAMFLANSHLVFAKENLAEIKIPACEYTNLIINVPSTLKLVAKGEPSGIARGMAEELDALKYTCANGKLEISTQNMVNLKEGFIFELANGSVSYLTLNGGQQADVTEIAAKNFNLEVNGSAKSLLDGKVENLIVSLNGSAQVDASSLKSQTGKVEINGSGLARINVSSELNATVNGSGSIEYLAKPKILNMKANGSGMVSLIK